MSEYYDMGPPSKPPSIRETIIEMMVAWFFENFENPAERTPYDEGCYVWIWGGPCDAREELYEAFSGQLAAAFGLKKTEKLIEAAVERIEEEDGNDEWAPSGNRMQPEQGDEVFATYP
jgi:hypothetical protein